MLYLNNPFKVIYLLIISILIGFYLHPIIALYFYFVVPVFLFGFWIGASYVQYRFNELSYMFNWNRSKFPNYYGWTLFLIWIALLYLYEDFMFAQDTPYFFTLWIIPYAIGNIVGASHCKKYINAKVLFSKTLERNMYLSSFGILLMTPTGFKLMKEYKGKIFLFETLVMLPAFIILPLFFAVPLFIGILNYEVINETIGFGFSMLIYIIFMVIGGGIFTAIDDIYREYLVTKLFPNFNGKYKDIYEYLTLWKRYFESSDSWIRTTYILNGKNEDWVKCNFKQERHI